MHNKVFYQCDWTGYAMKAPFCYMPAWDANGKLLKKGSYCNWESVMAHACKELEDAKASLECEPLAKCVEHFEAVRSHIENICGTVINCAPDFMELSHFTGAMTPEEFQRNCETTATPITVVKISPNGDIFEAIVNPTTVQVDNFAHYLHKPYSCHESPHRFNTMRKKGSASRDLAVFHYACKDLSPNQVASNVFKMQLYGDVLMVQQSREQCWVPRERFVSFTRQQFCDQFLRKRKRAQSDVPHLTVADYDKVKNDMQTVFNEYEAKLAKNAVPPEQMSKTMQMPKRVKGDHVPKTLRLAQAVA